jgi:hypothetical protein
MNLFIEKPSVLIREVSRPEDEEEKKRRRRSDVVFWKKRKRRDRGRRQYIYP